MTTEEMQKQIESMMPAPNQIVESIDKKRELSMDYEKAYKEALNRAKHALDCHNQGMVSTDVSLITSMFPELIESEDENTRKGIIELVKQSSEILNKKNQERMLAWLEKQGKQKPTSDIKYKVSAGGSLSVNGKPFDYEKATITQKDFSPEEEMVGETKSKLTPFDKKVRDFLFSFYLKVSDGMPLTEMVDAVHQLYTMIFGVEQKPFDYENANIQQKDFAPINVTDEGIVEAIKNTSVLDMVEPKFKVGDYIVSDYCKGRVVELTDDAYLLDSGQGIPFSCEHNAHLWTIEDAKDGDVLVDKYGNIGIYQGYKNTVRWNSYCYCGVNKAFYDEGSHEFPCYPATKEQRELLFKKIKEAGYEGDAEKKELKIVDWSKYIKYEPNSPSIVEPKQEWSEKDEEMANDLIEGCLSSEKTHHLVHTSKEIADWLKSLKDRMKGKEE